MIHPSIVLAVLATTALTATADPAHIAWRWQQSVEVTAAGMVRLDLPPPTLDASLPDLADLRLLSPTGVESPYLTELPVPSTARQQRAGGFKATLIEAVPGGAEAATVLDATTGTNEPIQAVTLDSPAPEFIKSVNIEGTRDGAEWQPIATREVIFRQAGGAARMRVPVPSGVWRQLRLTVSDTRSAPVAFTGAVFTLTDSKAPETIAHAVALRPATGPAGTSRVTLDLGAANLHLADLTLAVSDPVFSRSYVLESHTTNADGNTTVKTLGNGTLYRVLGENSASTEHLLIPVHQRVSSQQLVLTVQNGDSPPLTITGASGRRYPTTLAFHAPQPGTWKLLTGNRKATAPHYDLAGMRTELTKAGGQRLTPGPLQAKDDFQAPSALPGVDPAGATIDLAKWGFRRAVNVPATGVIRIELDPSAIAHANDDLGDLRLVQDGRQLPYLIDPTPVLRVLQPAVAVQPDEKRPRFSRWQLTLPLDNLALTDLQADSPSPLFTRTFLATAQRKDSLGNAWTQAAGTATWTKSADSNSNAACLQVPMSGIRMPRVFFLETDNGDNPPIMVENIRVRYAAPVITAKLVTAAPVMLYYGNPQATTPAYDLRLVRAELLAAEKQSASLAAEEVLRPDRASREEASTGSPWLWGALALVVAILLLVVAKMLPKPAATAE